MDRSVPIVGVVRTENGRFRHALGLEEVALFGDAFVEELLAEQAVFGHGKPMTFGQIQDVAWGISNPHDCCNLVGCLQVRRCPQLLST